MTSLPPGSFEPDWSLHPGLLLKTMLDRRGMRQAQLAERTGLSAKHINQLVNQSIGLSADVALLLGRALDTPPLFWARAEADHQVWLSSQRAHTALVEAADWGAQFDRATLLRHRVIDPGDDPPTVVGKVLRFFKVASAQVFDTIWLQPEVSFRRSQVYGVAEQNTALWLRLIEPPSDSPNLHPVRSRLLRQAVETIPGAAQLGVRDGFIAARTALAEAGVRLCFVRQVPGSRVIGATRWIGDQPVIGLTERNRRIDGFWFTLLHEIGHLLLHPKRRSFLDLEEDKVTADGPEKEADDFAVSILFPPEVSIRIARATNARQLVQLAAQLNLPVALIAGRHGYLTKRWQIGSKLRGQITDADVNALEQC